MVYLDHSATTPLDPEVLAAMMPYLTEEYGNASSVYGLGQRARHLVTSGLEHDAVLRCADFLEEEGFEVTRLLVDRDGLVDPDDLRRALRRDTILVSIMHANNEIGTIEPIAELVAATRAHSGAVFHTAAVQSTRKIPTQVDELGGA